MSEIPLPPIEMRRLVGPTEARYFDNPTGGPIFDDVPAEAFSVVFDFGCGCGRLARQLMQQKPRPRRYLGVDRHPGMVEWCRTNLAPMAPEFEFRTHGVFPDGAIPPGTIQPVPLPVGDGEVQLFIAWSVFTHLLEPDAEFYLRELSRVIGPDGVAVTTWFLFEKLDYPMMQEFQNALMINYTDPTNAVIFDRTWLSTTMHRHGLMMTRIIPPRIRGFQWRITVQKARADRHTVAFPEDVAPRGLARPPLA